MGTNQDKPYRDKQWLYQKYIVEDLSQAEIGEICGVHQVTIGEWVRKYDIPTPERCEVKGRFWENVDVRGPNECWEWQAGRHDRGYGMVRHGDTYSGAHRVAYEECIGEIGDLNVLHKCDNPPCVNPNHLSLGDQSENITQAVQRGRMPVGEDRHSSKLTEDDVREIRSRYESEDTSHAKLSAEYGVSANQIGQIVRRDHWKHVD